MVKTAVVTGGYGGIGLEIVKVLIENNYNVVLCDLDEDIGNETVTNLQKEFPECSSAFRRLDIRNGKQFKDVLDEIKTTYGSISVLVNNAGIANDHIDKWETEVDINFTGTHWGCIHGLKTLERGGTIINIASVTACRPMALFPIYSTIKAALLHTTTIFGTKPYFDKFGIKMMAVLPGMTDTPLIKSNTERHLFPELKDSVEDPRKAYGLPQSPRAVANCVMTAIKSELNGSLWLVEGGQPPKLVELTFSLKELTGLEK